MKEHLSLTLELTTKEASGRVLLGNLIVELAKGLNCIFKVNLHVD